MGRLLRKRSTRWENAFITEGGTHPGKQVRRLWRLQIGRGNRSWRSRCRLSRAPEESQPHRRSQSDRLGHWATDTHLKRFRREAEAAARLDHPGIVPIYEVGERDGSCYFSMKLVEGGQLDEGQARANADSGARLNWSPRSRAPCITRTSTAFSIEISSPETFCSMHKGEPHLTDFGLARLVETESTVTRTLEVLGTPSYMAPEQAVGNNYAVGTRAQMCMDLALCFTNW